MIPILRTAGWLPTGDTRECVWEKKDTWLKMARSSPFVPFGLVWAIVAWFKLFWPGFGLSNTQYNLSIFEIDIICVQPSNCQHGLQDSSQKLSDFIDGAKYLVRLANHLADVHQLDHIKRRQYLQEAKLQSKVKVVVYESEADNSGKNTILLLAIQYRQEKVYELSRRNEASFKAQAKRTTTNNARQTSRKKERSNSLPRGHRGIV